MAKCIAIVALIIGLLRFAQDAPDMIKKLFGGMGGLLNGIDLNPKGMMKKELSSARDSAKNLAGKAAEPFKAMGRFGKGAVGAFSGAASGLGENKFDKNHKLKSGFRKLAGGARGLVSGASAGANNRGFRGTAQAGQYAGAAAGRISSRNRTAYGTAQSQYNTTLTSMMDLKKTEIDKKKEAKKELDAQYKTNVSDYIADHIEAYTNSAKSGTAATAAYAQSMRDQIAAEVRRTGSTRSAVMADATFMANARAEAEKARTSAASLEANAKALSEAEGLYKASYEADKSKIATEIAALQGKALEGNDDVTTRAVEEFFKSQGDWGTYISGQYNDSFNRKMGDKNMDAAVAQTINQALNAVLGTNTKYAGDGAVKSLTQADVQKLMNSIKSGNTPSGVSVDNQRVALAQILNVMDSAAKTTNANISVYSTAQSTYNPAPASSGESK